MPKRADRGAQFHPNIKMEYADRSFATGYKNGYITPDDEKIIREYVTEMGALRHISEGRKLKIIFILTRWRLFISLPYYQATYNDVLTGIEGLKTGKSKKGKPFEQNTLHDYLRILKSFLLWMIENKYSTLPERKINKLGVTPINHDTTRPEDLLTHDEIMLLLTNCRSQRDRALISTAYESGCRVGELARIQWRDLQNDKYGYKMWIHDKKGKQTRYARLVKLAPSYLAQWREQYQGETGKDADGENFVFLNNRNEPLEYQAVKAMLSRVSKRAGIKKRVHSHLFRKSRITDMISEGYRESIVKEMMWKNPNTAMLRTYQKLHENDIDKEVFAQEKIIKRNEIKQEFPKEVVCPNCATKNAPTNQFCHKCGEGLTKEAKNQIKTASVLSEDELEDIINNPEKNILRLKRLKEILETLS